MTEIPEAARARFAKLAKQLGGDDGEPTAHREGFGTGSLFVGRKMFAVLDTTGALVLKLPPTRVQELVRAGIGTGWHPGSGAPLKEYVAGGAASERKWLALAKESREYMATKR